jgi:hypothetical protein
MMPISSYTTTILFLYTFLVLICQSSCFPTPRTQSQRLGQTSCRSSPSSQSNNSHDTNIQPWVGIASIKRSKNKEPNSSNYLCSNPEVEIQTSKDHSKNDFSWLHVRRDDITAVEDDVNVNHFIATETKHDDEEGKGTAATKYKYDLSSPREWLEYQEMKDGIHGAYTVLRCDLFMNNKQNHDQRYKLWGKGFHLKRISNSFIQMAMQNHEEHKNDCKSILEQALIDSEQILDALIREVIDSCVGIESVSSLEQPNEGSVKIVMLTLLWTPSRCLNHSNELSISVRGHSYCSNLFSDPQLYDPKPITASVALPITTALTKVGPSRYDNLPAAKLSSWCRLRRPLEQLYKDRDIVGEVLLTRQRVIDGNENLNEWILLEGLTSNLFIVYKDGSIRTNSVERKKYGGVLGGYARHLVIEAAKQCDIPIVFGPINLDDGKHGLWAEAFVSSSIRLMAPIGRILVPDCIDGQPHLQELWSETELDKLPWTKRKWLCLYRCLIHKSA